MRPIGDERVRLVRRGVGYAALGPRFYVWDTEPRAALDGALALLDPNREPRRGPETRSARMRLRGRRR